MSELSVSKKPDWLKIKPPSGARFLGSQEALKLGIKTEERSIELYSNSAQETGIRSSKDLFLTLVDFEKEHKKILEDALYYLGQEGSWYGYSPPTIED